MKSFTEEGMLLMQAWANTFTEGDAESAWTAVRAHLQAMEDRLAEAHEIHQIKHAHTLKLMGRVHELEDENKRLRNSYLELRSIFRANMLRAFAGKDVDAEIDKALEIPDRVIFSATPQEGSEAP